MPEAFTQGDGYDTIENANSVVDNYIRRATPRFVSDPGNAMRVCECVRVRVYVCVCMYVCVCLMLCTALVQCCSAFTRKYIYFTAP